MKKVITIFLLLLFLIPNSGIAVSIHWCGGKLASFDLFAGGEHKCKCGKMDMKPNCCKNKTTLLKANNEMSKNTHFAFKISPKFFFILLTQINIVPTAQLECIVSDYYHPPLFKPKTPIYLLDRVFLI